MVRHREEVMSKDNRSLVKDLTVVPYYPHVVRHAMYHTMSSTKLT
jgi:hypothetical protein